MPVNAGYCGMFKTPTLRNVATRKVFFHNGRFKSLRDVIGFYNTRDTNPELWYPVVNGVVRKHRAISTSRFATAVGLRSLRQALVRSSTIAPVLSND